MDAEVEVDEVRYDNVVDWMETAYMGTVPPKWTSRVSYIESPGSVMYMFTDASFSR